MSDQKVASFWGCSSSSRSNASITTASSSVAANATAPTPSNLDALTTTTSITERTNRSRVSPDNDPNHSIEDDFYLIYQNENDKRKRQKLMGEKLQALRDLLPYSHQDHEALLDDTADYIKSLQLQLEMMSRCNEEEKPNR